MSEDIQDQIENKVEEKQFSEIEQKAIDMGWRPRQEFEGSDDDFIDAKEFVRRKPLFDKIEHTSRELKNVKKTLDSFKQHYSRVEEVAVQKAILQLKNARKEALAEGDGERFEQIDEQLQTAQSQLRQIEVAKNTPAVEDDTPHPDFVAFKNRNGWYQSDNEMTAFADKLGMGLAATGMSPQEVLKEIEQQIRTRFSSKFRNTRKEDAPDVNNSRNGGKPPKNEEANLTEDERKIMNTLVRSGAITKEKYIADLKKIKGVE